MVLASATAAGCRPRLSAKRHYAAAATSARSPALCGRRATTTSSQLVAHGELLPEALVERIPKSDARILSFFLAFLRRVGLEGVPVFINGGYVRDLLLEREPDDLDLCICLRGCEEGVTVSGLLAQLPDFATETEEFGIREVRISTMLSNVSKSKHLDTFKADFFDDQGCRTEVDVMPTIGEEIYEEENRIPLRDQRGTPEQDAVRRDLTIGAMLLRVESAGASLSYRLFDFYGGVGDIQAGTLRSPVPAGCSLLEVREKTLRSEADSDQAAALGMDAMSEEEQMQVLWWAKILKDDPLRACRVFRFRAKLQFEIHPAFWTALPFALAELQNKVAGSRKRSEYTKIASYGAEVCGTFLEGAFCRSVTDQAGNERNVASALLGGMDMEGDAAFLSEVVAFDRKTFLEIVPQLISAGIDECEDERLPLGALMAAAVFCADFGGGYRDLPRAAEEFMFACEGLSAAHVTRDSGAGPLDAAARWLEPFDGARNPLEASVAAACGVAPHRLSLMLQVWRDVQLPGNANRPPWPAWMRQLSLAMTRYVDADRAEEVEQCLEVLLVQRPPVRGRVFEAGHFVTVPPGLRKLIMDLLEVALRLRGLSDPLEDAEQAEQLLEEWPELREAISWPVWYEADGETLRPELCREMLLRRQGGGSKKKRRGRQ